MPTSWGFEHAATSAADKAKVRAAKAKLSRPHDLFRLSDEARCTVTSAHVELQSEDDDGHAEHDDHADHQDETNSGHNEKDAEHMEVQAHYKLDCARPDAIGEITFRYFDAFPGAQALDVQILTATGQHRFEIERGQDRISLKGII